MTTRPKKQPKLNDDAIDGRRTLIGEGSFGIVKAYGKGREWCIKKNISSTEQRDEERVVVKRIIMDQRDNIEGTGRLIYLFGSLPLRDGRIWTFMERMHTDLYKFIQCLRDGERQEI